VFIFFEKKGGGVVFNRTTLFTNRQPYMGRREGVRLVPVLPRNNEL
jgi:hypothetical protein